MNGFHDHSPQHNLITFSGASKMNRPQPLINKDVTTAEGLPVRVSPKLAGDFA